MRFRRRRKLRSRRQKRGRARRLVVGAAIYLSADEDLLAAEAQYKSQKKKNAVADPDSFDVIEEKALIEETDEQEG